MRKSLFVLVLALVLVFSFSAIAGAKYAGYAGSSLRYDGAAMSPTVLSNAPGYMSWGTAKAQMSARGITNAEVLATPHGGYSIATAKCAVCHSVHRALGKAGIPNTVTAAPAEGMTLTAGANSCVECHTEWGAVGTGLPVEWAEPAETSRPHSGGCPTCHKGGIHGGGASQFHGMNVFMLGNVNDTQIATETAAGPLGNYDPAYQNPAGASAGQNWFWTGTSGANGVGGIPTGLNSADWSRHRQILTGYTCSQPGCHTNSMLSVGYWGFSREREQRDAANSFFKFTTGHKASPGSRSAHNGARCGPCHPGNPAGGYRVAAASATAIAGSGPVVGGVPQGTRSTNNARQYGCDQCHDMVGVLTNSTAFPHANRLIAVYEWDSAGAISVVASQAGGNLWMYTGFIGGTGNGNVTLDQSFKVNNNAVNSGITVGQWRDGVCLKCHVPVDELSGTILGVTPNVLRATNHQRATSWTAFPGYNANGSSLGQYLPYLFK